MLKNNNFNSDLLIFEKMNKGAIVLKQVDLNKQNEPVFKVVYANPGCFELIGEKHRKRFKSTFPLSNMLETDQQKLVTGLKKRGASMQFEHFHPQENCWHQLSFYCPQDSYLVIMIDKITEKKELEQKLAESEETLRMTLEITDEGIWEWHLDDQLVYHNKRWASIFGLSEDSTHHSMDFYMDRIHPDDIERVRATTDEVTKTGQPYYSEHRILHDDGTIIWIVDRGIPVKDKNGKIYRIVGSLVDTSKYKEAQESLFLEKEMIRSTILSVGDGIITIDVDGKINIMNPAAENLTGWTSEELFGLQFDDIFKLVDAEDDEEKATKLKHGPGKRAKLQNRQGEYIEIYYSISPIHLPDGQTYGHVIVFTDVSELVEAQKQIEYLSFHDDLTGLYNRHYLRDALHRLDSKRLLPFTIMILDINGLKEINDSYGHDEGDKLIKLTAEFLKANYRHEDIIARIGGDEFCILLPNTPATTAEGIKNRILQSAAIQEAAKSPVSFSIGYAVKTDEDENINDTFTRADQKMYEHKRQQKADS